ncbi:MAG: lactate utilization protein C [Rubrimonas sp.]
MSGRERILARLRRTIGAAEGREAAVAARLAGQGVAAPRPAQGSQEGEARLQQFEAKARAADATVTRIPDVAALPAALADELRRRNLPAAVRTGADPMFRGLDWGAVERSEGVGRIEETATLSRAEFGMAETGTLVLASGPDNPVTLTFLGETHFVALPAADVMAGFEDMWAAFRARGLDPRTTNMVTGPSRSADIGQTLQLGAHGPVALHIFLIG